jgi:hypothetical protein
MGNIFFNSNGIKFVSYNGNHTNKYIYNIEINEFNIEKISQKINELNIDKQLQNEIIYVLKYCQNNNSDILSQIDGFLFDKYDGLYYLEIKNMNAYNNKIKFNVTPSNNFYYICDIPKTFSNYNI